MSNYLDSEDLTGPLRKIFDDALSCILRNLSKVLAWRGVNAPGVPEISPLVFEKLLVNALIHRDYLVSTPIRFFFFIFDNLIKIVSPGLLPNNLTVEKIRLGISIIRNPVLASYAAKGILPYRGLGSGIKRPLDVWPEIDFTDDRDGCLFTAMIHRKEDKGSEIIKASPESSEQQAAQTEVPPNFSPNLTRESSEKIIALLREHPTLSARAIADRIGISQRAVEKQIAGLKRAGQRGALGNDRMVRLRSLVPVPCRTT